MLYKLLVALSGEIRAFNVFGYITLRAVLAMLTALLIALFCGPAVIRWLTAKKIGQAVRDDGPEIVRRVPDEPGIPRDLREPHEGIGPFGILGEIPRPGIDLEHRGEIPLRRVF